MENAEQEVEKMARQAVAIVDRPDKDETKAVEREHVDSKLKAEAVED